MSSAPSAIEGGACHAGPSAKCYGVTAKCQVPLRAGCASEGQVPSAVAGRVCFWGPSARCRPEREGGRGYAVRGPNAIEGGVCC